MKRKSPSSKLPADVRFWSLVDKQESGCWMWKGATGPKGYGRFNEYPVNVSAHRFSWSLVNGPIPAGMFVCHRCDNPGCVNPDHLFLGTPKDNTQDMLSKQRQSRGENHGDKIRASEKRYHKLTAEEVASIKHLLVLKQNVRFIAAAYDVTPRTVVMIRDGITWRHVDA
jgi:hypothetical protein